MRDGTTDIARARWRSLAWTEAVTKLTGGDVADEVYEFTKAQFPPAELAALTYAVVAINGWNRLCMSFRVPPNVPRELIQPDARALP